MARNYSSARPKSVAQKLAEDAALKADEAERAIKEAQRAAAAAGATEGFEFVELGAALSDIIRRLDRLERNNTAAGPQPQSLAEHLFGALKAAPAIAAAGLGKSDAAQRAARLIAQARGKISAYPAFNHGQNWTFENDRDLTHMANNGGTLVDMGSKLGRTPFAVFARMIKTGLVTEDNCYDLWADVVARGYRYER